MAGWTWVTSTKREHTPDECKDQRGDGPGMTEPADRMKRQAVLNRYAELDEVGFVHTCTRFGNTKIVFPDRSSAEAACAEMAALGASSRETYVYPCGKHFHFTSRSGPVPVRPAVVLVGDVVHVPGGINRDLPARHQIKVDGVGAKRLSGVVLVAAGQPMLSRKGNPRRCLMPLELLRHCTVSRAPEAKDG